MCIVYSLKSLLITIYYVIMETKSTNELLKERNVDPKIGLTTKQANEFIMQDGKNSIEEKKETFFQKIKPYFFGPIPRMIEAAMILSLITADYRDFIIILVMLLANAFIGWNQDKSAQNALDALKKDLALKAMVLRDAKWQEIDAQNVVKGDILAIKFGNIVPADGRIISDGFLSIDQSALTGESMLVNKKQNDDVYSGSIVKEGSVTILVTATGANTFFGKTAKLVSNAGATNHLTQQITSVGNMLIFGALILSAILVVFQLLGSSSINQGEILKIIKTVLVLLVATIPVAMPAVISVTIALGAFALSKKHAIVSKLNSIEALASVDTLCSDKTGTLTQNKLSVVDVLPFKDVTKDMMITYGVLASDLKGNDVIDLAIQKELVNKEVLNNYEVIKFLPFNPVSKRIEADIKEGDTTYKLIKGAPQVIIDLCSLEDEEKNKAQIQIDDLATQGYKSLGLARVDNQKYQYLGIFVLADPLREDSKETIDKLHDVGIGVKIITGDSQNIAKQIAGQLGIGDNILLANDIFSDDENKKLSKEEIKQIEDASGFAQVFPQHKYAIVKTLQDNGHICAMTGDGVNDSPALKQADCGIAVSGATDAARAAATLILLDPGLHIIKTAIDESKRIFARMMSYIYYRIAMTVNIMILSVVVTLLGSMLITRLAPTNSESFFPLTAIMLVLLALLDDIPIMTIAYDNTSIESKPAKWNSTKIFSISIVLGLVSVLQTILLVVWVDGSFSFVNSIAQTFNITHIWNHITTFDQLQTLLFLQLVVGGHLLLLITRNTSWFFKRPFPHIKLFTAIVSTQLLVVVLCIFGWFVSPIDIQSILIIWLYNIVWMFPLSLITILIHGFCNKKTIAK